MNIAILASGEGTNFEAIVRASRCGKLQGITIKLLITDKEYAPVRQRAKRYKIKDIFINPESFSDRRSFDRGIAKLLKQEKIRLIVLAGFMRLLSPWFVSNFKNKILNIHPALLPAFKGSDAIERAYNYGVKVTGVTVHFIDAAVDHGPIVLQRNLRVREKESLISLKHRIHNLEHKIYPEAIRLYVQGRIQVRKRKVAISIQPF